MIDNATQHQKDHPDEHHAYKMKHKLLKRLAKFGLSLEDYQAMQQAQNFRCAVCGSEKRLCIDHNHHTGQVRGILCYKCNLAIGLLQDDPSIFDALADYLRS